MASKDLLLLAIPVGGLALYAFVPDVRLAVNNALGGLIPPAWKIEGAKPQIGQYVQDIARQTGGSIAKIPKQLNPVPAASVQGRGSGLIGQLNKPCLTLAGAGGKLGGYTVGNQGCWVGSFGGNAQGRPCYARTCLVGKTPAQAREAFIHLYSAGLAQSSDYPAQGFTVA